MSNDKPPPDNDQPTESAGGPIDSSTAPLKRIGDFELLRELGRGGMGIVYEARQVSLNRRVALKVLPPGLGLTDTAVQRFEREARAAAKLHHTNIVPVHAIGEEEGCHYYAMELIEGQPLSDVLRDLTGEGSNPLLDETVTKMGEGVESRPEPTTSQESTSITSLSDSQSGGRKWFDAVAKLIAEVADGLEYAHGRGVIHRDIKPANLMLSKEGKLCVTDFGLARVAQEPGMTVSGSLMGTPAYMSPEQIAVGRMKLDHRTDIYSLGAVLYELLTHRRPFPGESREEILGGILTKDPRPPRRFNPRIPVDLETICQKAMEKDQDRRYQNAGEFANDLRQYLQHGLISAKRAGIPRRMWKSVRRHPTAATATGLLILFAVVVAGVVWIQGHRSAAAEVERLVLEAELAWTAGMYEENLALAEQALAIDSHNSSARLLQVKALIHLDRTREAVLDARDRLADVPNDWHAHLILALASTSEKNPDLSIDPEEHIRVLEETAPESSEAYYARAQIASGPIEALELLDRALELDPLNAVALKARINYLSGDFKDFQTALLDCERLIAARPRSPQGYRFKSSVLRQLRQYEAALEVIQRAIDMTDADEQPFEAMWNFWQRAYIHGMRQDYRERKSDLDRAIEVNPDFAQAIVNRAQTYTSIGEYKKALADARRALEINPDFMDAYNKLFPIYWALKQPDELRVALEDLEQRAEGWRDHRAHAKASVLLSSWYLKLDDTDKALAHAERAVELDPTYLWGYWARLKVRQRIEGNRGIQEDCDHLATITIENLEDDSARGWHLAYTCKRPEQAIEIYSRIIERAPHWADVYYQRGNLYFARNEYAKALEDNDRAIELAPAWADPYRQRGEAHSNAKRFEEALMNINHAIELEPNNLNATYSRAVLYMNLELFNEARADYEWIFEQVPKGVNGRVSWSTALLRLGREEEALATVDRAIEMNPEMDYPIRWRGLLLMFVGRTDEAVKYVERAVEHSPKNAMNYAYRSRAILNGDGGCDRALADLATARELAPDDPDIANEIAWNQAALVCRQCPDDYDGSLALDLARMAVEDKPEGDYTQIAHGMALYRHGRFREAREALLRAAELRVPKPEPFELFALAMTEWKLGSRAEARSYYGRAVVRMNETYPRFPEYIFFKEEAAELLGIEP